MKKLILFIFVVLAFQACFKSSGALGRQGFFKFELKINDDLYIPFFVEMHGGEAVFSDGEGERMWTVEKGLDDSIVLKHKVFDSELHFKWREDSLAGKWYNQAKKNYTMDLRGYRVEGKEFFSAGETTTSVMGKWATVFGKGTDDEYPGLGIFKQRKDRRLIEGTFRTETGDYRYLSGPLDSNKLMLSTFDGAHAFLFIATLEGEKLNGTFYSGKHWSTTWEAKKADTLNLRNPTEITKVVSDFNLDELSFEQLNSDAKLGFDDAQFSGKPIMVQILGTWCPNCYDETKYFNTLHEEYAGDGLKIVGVCFENQEDVNEAKARIKRFKERVNVEYTLVYGGRSSKQEASKAFPFLNKITSYPTTLFFNKEHTLAAIHTGFNGPKTGDTYLAYTRNVESILKQIL